VLEGCGSPSIQSIQATFPGTLDPVTRRCGAPWWEWRTLFGYRVASLNQRSGLGFGDINEMTVAILHPALADDVTQDAHRSVAWGNVGRGGGERHTRSA
jgi:hypothetical protein